MSTNNMKCTWPTQKLCVGDPMQPIFYWLALGFCVGGNANFMFRVGGNAFMEIPTTEEDFNKDKDGRFHDVQTA